MFTFQVLSKFVLQDVPKVNGNAEDYFYQMVGPKTKIDQLAEVPAQTRISLEGVVVQVLISSSNFSLKR